MGKSWIMTPRSLSGYPISPACEGENARALPEHRNIMHAGFFCPHVDNGAGPARRALSACFLRGSPRGREHFICRTWMEIPTDTCCWCRVALLADIILKSITSWTVLHLKGNFNAERIRPARHRCLPSKRPRASRTEASRSEDVGK